MKLALETLHVHTNNQNSLSLFWQNAWREHLFTFQQKSLFFIIQLKKKKKNSQLFILCEIYSMEQQNHVLVQLPAFMSVTVHHESLFKLKVRQTQGAELSV